MSPMEIRFDRNGVGLWRFAPRDGFSTRSVSTSSKSGIQGRDQAQNALTVSMSALVLALLISSARPTDWNKRQWPRMNFNHRVLGSSPRRLTNINPTESTTFMTPAPT
jgi:hypothetical protein